MVKKPVPGIRPCMRCGWLFVSPDVQLVRRCHDCKQEEMGLSAREIRVGQAHDSDCDLSHLIERQA